MTRLGVNQSECRSPPLERIPENAARKLISSQEKLIIAVAGFPAIYDVSLFAYSGNSIHLLKTISKLVNVSYNVEIRLALNH